MIKRIFKAISVGIEIIFLAVNDEAENIHMGDRNREIKDHLIRLPKVEKSRQTHQRVQRQTT